MILTDASESVGYSREFISKRMTQIEKVCSELNFRNMYKLGLPTTRLHAVDFNELLSGISSVINEVKPEVVYTVNRSDIHTDHQIAARAVMSCTKSFRYPFVKRLLMYECLSETEMAAPLPENIFVPNVYSDISDFLDRKVEIIKTYESEVQEPPSPRSTANVIALARFRGSTVGVDYAEAFMLVRDLF